MELSLKDFKKVLPVQLVKNAAKNRVRECDEISKGVFQAYVDFNDDSFDVSVTINSVGKITAHSCDCKNKRAFCVHKIALLLFITKEKKSSGLMKAGRKANPLDTLLEEADTEKLKAWLRELLTKNKEVALAFTHHFSIGKREYTPEEIRKLTLDAVKAVVRNKKKLEAGDVKKIVDLWTSIHEPVIAQYLGSVTTEALFLNFSAIVETCDEVISGASTTSVRFVRYQDGVIFKVAEQVSTLQEEAVWKEAVKYPAGYLVGPQQYPRRSMLFLLTHLFNRTGEERKKELVDMMAKQYAAYTSGKYYGNDQFTIIVFGMVEATGLFSRYYKLFKPSRFQNDYNLTLIGRLVEHQQLTLAEVYCKEQIGSNSRNEYSVPYLNLLRQIYTIQQDEKKLAGVIKELFPNTFDFDDFLFISSHIKDEDEKKKWRSSMLTRARGLSAYSYHQEAGTFVFRLMDAEGNYKKMIGYINNYTPYSLIVEYADKMALAGKKDLLKKLLDKRDDTYWRYEELPDEDKPALFSQLHRILNDHFTKTELKLFVRQTMKGLAYYRPGEFCTYLDKMLR